MEIATWNTNGGVKVIPKPVEVRCYQDRAAFEAPCSVPGYTLDRARHLIAYYDHGNTIHMRAATCPRSASSPELRPSSSPSRGESGRR